MKIRLRTRLYRRPLAEIATHHPRSRPRWRYPAARTRCNCWTGPTGQERWRFRLVAGQDVQHREQIDWRTLLPGGRLTGWLGPDLQQKTLRIDPFSGYDD